MRNQLTAPLILSIRQFRFSFQIFNWQEAWKIGWMKTWNGEGQDTIPGLFTVFHHPFCKCTYSVQQHGRNFKSYTLSLTTLPQHDSQVWNHHLLLLFLLFLQVNSNRAKNKLRGEIEEIFSGRDRQESPRLMHQWVTGADLEQRWPEAWVCSYGMLHKSGSLPGL